MIKKDKKLVVLGIDGLPYSLLIDYCQQGIMPECAKILKKGRISPLEVVLPEISAVSWSSFMTGKDPSAHGIFGFFDFRRPTYQIYFPLFFDLQAPPFFDELADRGLRSVIINLPATYPVRPVNGVLISGFFAPDLKRAVYPGSYYQLLQEKNYLIDVDVSDARNKKEKLINDLNFSLQRRLEIAKILWSREQWNLFGFFITETDRLHHFLFKAARDKNHPFHKAFVDFYQKIDYLIAEFYEVCEKSAIPLIILSDHGFEELKKEFYLNPLFKAAGLLEKRALITPDSSQLSSASRALALDPTRIYLNSRSRFSEGKINDQVSKQILKEISDLLLNFQSADQKPVRAVFEADEIYREKNSSAPDLIVLASGGFDIKAGWQKNSIIEETGMEGKHTYDGALFFATSDFPLITNPASITQIAPLIINYFQN